MRSIWVKHDIYGKPFHYIYSWDRYYSKMDISSVYRYQIKIERTALINPTGDISVNSKSNFLKRNKHPHLEIYFYSWDRYHSKMDISSVYRYQIKIERTALDNPTRDISVNSKSNFLKRNRHPHLEIHFSS